MNGDIKTKKTKSFGDFEVSSDFECGSCNQIIKINGDNFFIKVYSDPKVFGWSYNWYFCIKISKKTDQPKKIILFAGNEYTKIEGMFNKSLAPVFISQNFREWLPSSNIWQNNSGAYKIELDLAPYETQYISNSLPRPYSNISSWLRDVACENENICHLKKIGKSVQGRELLALSITENTNESKKDRILVTSGFHPAEPDTLATEAIIDFLISDDNFAQEIRKKFIVDIIPQMNPDGFVLGTSGCNANGINLYWDFRQDDLEKAPEAYYLWQWMLHNPPILYIDFHAYVHQPQKDYGPYIKPTFDYNSREVRRLVKSMDGKLIQLSHGRFVGGFLTNLPTTLAYKATKEFNTITYTKYHLHLKHGVKKSMEVGLNVFKELSTELIYFCKNPKKSRLSEKILNKPYGKVNKDYLFTVPRTVYQPINKNISPLISKFIHFFR